jgi:hypothetical protein
MARTINVISQQMLDAKAADSNLNGLTSNSKVAIWRLWVYIVAACINIFEQLMDAYKIEIEAIADTAIPGTPQWVKDRTFRFQYDATVPQVLEVNEDLTLSYETEDDTKKIVTRCSVTQGVSKTVSIKVAKATSITNDAPTQLTTPEYNSLVGYWNLIGFAGLTYNVINKVSDKVSVTATIYYQGQYAATIQSDVESAIKNYIASIPFDGKIRVSKIEDAIQAVIGVSDLKINTIQARDNDTVFASGTKVYDLATGVNLIQYQMIAGYAVEEDTTSYTFADTITYVAL